MSTNEYPSRITRQPRRRDVEIIDSPLRLGHINLPVCSRPTQAEMKANGGEEVFTPWLSSRRAAGAFFCMSAAKSQILCDDTLSTKTPVSTASGEGIGRIMLLDLALLMPFLSVVAYKPYNIRPRFLIDKDGVSNKAIATVETGGNSFMFKPYNPDDLFDQPGSLGVVLTRTAVVIESKIVGLVGVANLKSVSAYLHLYRDKVNALMPPTKKGRTKNAVAQIKERVYNDTHSVREKVVVHLIPVYDLNVTTHFPLLTPVDVARLYEPDGFC